MAEGIFTRDEIQARLNSLQESIQKSEMDGALIVQRADLIYYTGAAFHGALVVPATGEIRLLVWRGLPRIGDFCPVAPTLVKGFGKLPAALNGLNIQTWKCVGLEKDCLPVSWYETIVGSVWQNAEIHDVSPIIRKQRSVKSLAEQEQSRKCGQVLATGFDALRGILKEGIYEYEAQALMDVVMRGAGDQALGRSRGFNSEARGVVACGASASSPSAFDGPIGQPGRNPLAPAGAGNGEIHANAPIIADHTAGYNGYMTDMTRTFYIGELDQRFVDAHNFCVQVHREVLKRMIPGAIPGELYQWAVAEAEKAGYGDVFMNQGYNRVRFLAHGVGIELDEWPVLARPFKDPLETGMIIAVEPKIIFDDGGVGVEDTVIVQPGGAEIITPMDHDLIRVG